MPIDLNQHEHRQYLETAIRADIDAFSLTLDDGPRTHLGASLIGNPCNRYLWFVFRWMFHKIAEPRMYRLWNRGHREEEWFAHMLRSRGWIIHTVDPETGKQFRVSACGGHFGGSFDALGLAPAHYGLPNEWLLLEFKTNKDGEKWTKIETLGITGAKPLHWSQTSTYGYLKSIRFMVYCQVNKDDDRLHIECKALDWNLGAREVQKANFVILQTAPPAKLHENPARFECKYCDALQVCHKGAAVLVNCRSCSQAKPVADKAWYCMRFSQTIPENVIKTGCAHHNPLVH